MTLPDLGAYLNRTEPHLRTMQLISDRFREPVGRNLLHFCIGVGTLAAFYIVVYGVIGVLTSYQMEGLL